MPVRLAAVCLSLASLLAAIPLQPAIRSDNGVSGDASTASLSCGSQYISCCTDDSSVCNLAKGWDGDLGEPSFRTSMSYFLLTLTLSP